MALFFKACFYFSTRLILLTASGVRSIYNSDIQTRAYSNATLCQNCNAIGALLSGLYGLETDAEVLNKLAVTFLYI
jgi:hypothetical protein